MTVPPWAYRPGAGRSELGEEGPLVAIVHNALGREGAGWSVEIRPPYCVVAPSGRSLANQGWKLHVSATVLSAPDVLARVLPILQARRCHFKFVRSLGDVATLNDVHAPEALSGKFLTIYPGDDADAVALAAACDQATSGLAGPRIMSDRPLRPGSLVHYRYGAFGDGLVRWSLLEELEDVVIGPDGTAFPDRRGGRFAPPPWAVDPFPRGSEPAVPSPSKDGAVRLGAYRVDRLIARSNRGGIYRASDPRGRRVVIKEARPHVATDRFGRDARDRLRHEEAILGLLAGETLCPAPVEFFGGGDHCFLAMEDVGRRSLRDEIVRGATGWGRPFDDDALRSLARRLVALMTAAHAAGVIVRDLNPGNLVRGDDNVLRLVDLEAAYRLDDTAPWFRAATPAYASPQQVDNQRPTPADDVFGLGATLFFAATATDPSFYPDDDGGRAVVAKVDELLRLHGTPPWTGELIRRCLAPAPADRPGLDEIAAAADPAARIAFPAGPPPVPATADLWQTVDGVLAYLDAARAARAGDRLWPTTMLGQRTDALNVANGNAGVGLFLCQAAATRPAAVALLAEAAEVTRSAVERDRERPAGLYFGLAGVAWFLAEAGRVLADPSLIESAVRVLTALPETLGTPDVAQGNAGLCLAAARLALLTGEPAMTTRARVAAGVLVDATTATPFGPGWIIPATHTPDGHAKIYPGFGFGSTGIAYALLTAARLTGEEGFAARAVEALTGVVEAGRTSAGGWHWPTSDSYAPGAPGWLKGAAGIGAGLVRAWTLTGESRFREAALGCLALLQPVPVGAPLAQFHGLAGVGEFVLDCRTFLPEAEFDGALTAVRRIIYAQRVDQRASGFGLFFPDEEGLTGADFGTGGSGVASFLLRSLEGGPRPMTLDDLLIGSGAARR